jgi:hypothetical protein
MGIGKGVTTSALHPLAHAVKTAVHPRALTSSKRGLRVHPSHEFSRCESCAQSDATVGGHDPS